MKYPELAMPRGRPLAEVTDEWLQSASMAALTGPEPSCRAGARGVIKDIGRIRATNESTDFLFTRSATWSAQTQPLTDETTAQLRAAASVSRFESAGWHCATARDQSGRIIVMVHAKSRDELEMAIDPDHLMNSWVGVD